MKMMGRKHRQFFRICATDSRSPRDGKVLEELGTYDPMVSDTDARVTLNGERVNYWLSVGAQPSEKVKVFIKKYGTDGTHVAEAQAARERLSLPKVVPPAPTPVELPTKEVPAEAVAAADSDEAPSEEGESAVTEDAAGDAEEPTAE
jgi:small subunit ribosomal protein S16